MIAAPSGRPAECPYAQPVRRVEETIGAPEFGIDRIGRPSSRGAPQLALDFIESAGELCRPPRGGNVRVRPAAPWKANVFVRDPRQVGKDDSRMGEGGEIPWLGAAKDSGRPPGTHRQRSLHCFLGCCGPPLGLVGGRLDTGRCHAAEEKPQLCDARGVRPKPAEESNLDAFEVRQRPIGKVIGSAGGQLTLIHSNAEKLTGPSGEVEPFIEFEESALLDIAHSAPPPVPVTLHRAVSGASAA
jgi:hypothetical protein